MKVDFRSKSSWLQRIAVAVGGVAIRRSRLVLAAVVVITAVLTPYAFRLEYDDDVIQFLPEGDPNVERFRDIGTRFHGLNIGIVGVEISKGDLFSGEHLALIRALSRDIPNRVAGVSFVTSIDSVQDVVEVTLDDGTRVSEVADLVPRVLPRTEEGWETLRQRVLSREHIRGALISESGDAAIVLCNFQPNAPVKQTADEVQRIAEEIQEGIDPGAKLHFGGAPFIGAYVANGTRKDLNRLSPFVCGAIILIILFTARSLVGTFIALGSVGISIAWVMGIMGVASQPLTLVSSSLPVILVALGSAYSIHLLARVLSNLDGGETDRALAVQEAVREVGPPIFVAGLTTALAFSSFVVMDIRPMRVFGLWMAGGTLLTVIQALLVVPAACVLLPLRARGEDRAPRWAIGGLVRGATAVARHPRWSTGVVIVLLVVSAVFTAKVSTHMETRAFFEEGSVPVMAEDFLEEKLGGSLYLQVEIRGDISNPLVLRQIERFADSAAAQEGVTGVQSLALPVRLGLLGAKGEKRIPWSLKSSRAIREVVGGEKDLVLLVDPPWEHTLVHIKLGGFDTERASVMAESLQKLGAATFVQRVAIPREKLSGEAARVELREIATHVADLLAATGRNVETEEIEERLDARIAELSITAASIQKEVHTTLSDLLGDPDDRYLEVREYANWFALVDPISAGLSSGSLTIESLAELLTPLADPEEEDGESIYEAAGSIYEYLVEIMDRRREKAIAGALEALLGEKGDVGLNEKLIRAVGPLVDPVAFVPASAGRNLASSNKAGMTFEVSGYPMVYMGMNESVQRNQTFSMLVSFGLVILALSWFFRSFVLAIVTAIPAGLTLLVTFGVMGALDIPMDVGTSMISSIALGVGIDYAVHLVWRHGAVEAGDADTALVDSLRDTGWGIVINALEVSVGFGLLMLGTIVPMQNFGMLTALAMLVSAAASLLLIPMLARWAGIGLRRQSI